MRFDCRVRRRLVFAVSAISGFLGPVGLAYAEPVRRPATSFWTTGMTWNAVGVGVTAVVLYVLLFHLVFPTLLRRNVRPLRAYAFCWFGLILLSVACFLVVFFQDLIPRGATLRSSFWYRYGIHLLIGAVGLILGLAPFWLFRPGRAVGNVLVKDESRSEL